MPAGLIAEMQALDDFIVITAAELPVETVDGVSVVFMLDGQADFEQLYPEARTLRDRIPYPVKDSPSRCSAPRKLPGVRRP